MGMGRRQVRGVRLCACLRRCGQAAVRWEGASGIFTPIVTVLRGGEGCGRSSVSDLLSYRKHQRRWQPLRRGATLGAARAGSPVRKGRPMFGDNLERIVAAIEKNYEADEIFFTKPGRRFPSRTAIKGLITELRRVLFPGYFGPEMLSPSTSPSYFIGQTLIDIESVLRQQLILALTYTSDDRDDLVGSGNHLCGGCTSDSICEQTADICTKFFDALPEIQRTLLTDVQALYDGDPAAGSKEEVIFTYPGLYAIYVYRIAHVLYDLGVPIIPRVMTEIAHSSTGIDIGAGAHIGEYFFIDHGTGVVIGETTTIGDHVKLYQGVTLGALSTRGGQRLAGVKRHPTIEDNVTIYSNASVLGGETVIGEGSVIAGSTFVTFSVPPHSRVSVKEQEIRVRQPGERD